MSPDRKLRVFLCHASQDKPAVRELYKKLCVEDWIQPWLDEEELLPGQDWNLEIEKAVESSDAVIVCVSHVSVAKEGYVQKELRQVLEIALNKLDGAIFVIPVRLDECELPRSIRDRQGLDFFPEDRRDSAMRKLFASLRTDGAPATIEGAPAPAPSMIAEREPERPRLASAHVAPPRQARMEARSDSEDEGETSVAQSEEAATPRAPAGRQLAYAAPLPPTRPTQALRCTTACAHAAPTARPATWRTFAAAGAMITATWWCWTPTAS